MTDDHNTDSQGREPTPALTVDQTALGYWSVQRAGVQVAFAMTRAAAERERDTLERLGRCTERRSRRPQHAAA